MKIDKVKLEVCADCPLSEFEFKYDDWVGVDLALTSLSGAYEDDETGELTSLNKSQLEKLRQSEIEEWMDVGGYGVEAATALEDMPEIVDANYQCDHLRSLGKCSLNGSNEQGEKNG